MAKRIRKYCLDNNHRLTFIMKPNVKFQEKQSIDEASRLEKKLSSLSANEKEKIYEDGIKLVQKQEQKEGTEKIL